MTYLLFVCKQNAGRYQNAEAFFERAAPSDPQAESVGLDQAIGFIPIVIEPMTEVGTDLSSSRP